MSNILLTQTRFKDGIWEGILTGPDIEQVSVAVTYHENEVEGVVLDEVASGARRLKIPIPQAAIGDGVHTFVVVSKADASHLGSFSMICGDAVADDIRASLDLLRQELDLLKAAFRRQFAHKD